MKPKKVIKYLRSELTEEEHRKAAITLAQANETRAAIEEEKKVANSQFAERLAVANAAIGKNSRIISNGYEMRNVECEVVYHSGIRTDVVAGEGLELKRLVEMPQQKVTLRRDLLGVPSPQYPAVVPHCAIVAVEAMSEAELQEAFDFDQQAGQPSAADLDQAAEDYPHGTTTPLPLCATCKTEPVGKEGEVCGSCQADTKVNGKQKKAGKGPRASAERAGKVVTTAADQAQDEPF